MEAVAWIAVAALVAASGYAASRAWREIQDRTIPDQTWAWILASSGFAGIVLAGPCLLAWPPGWFAALLLAFAGFCAQVLSIVAAPLVLETPWFHLFRLLAAFAAGTLLLLVCTGLVLGLGSP